MDAKRYLMSGNIVRVFRDCHEELGLCLPDNTLQLQELRVPYDKFDDYGIEVATIYSLGGHGNLDIFYTQVFGSGR